MHCGVPAGQELQALCRFQNPHPDPPRRGGGPSDASHEPQVSSCLETTNHKQLNVTTSYKLQATSCFLDSPDEACLAAEIRGPCRKRSRGSAVADVQALERRGRFETFPYRQRAESLAWRYRRPQATGHGPSSRHHHHVLRTAYPQGGYMGPPLRRDDTPRDTTRNLRPVVAGHLPLFRRSSQSGRKARASQSRPARFPSLVKVSKK